MYYPHLMKYNANARAWNELGDKYVNKNPCPPVFISNSNVISCSSSNSMHTIIRKSFIQGCIVADKQIRKKLITLSKFVNQVVFRLDCIQCAQCENHTQSCFISLLVLNCSFCVVYFLFDSGLNRSRCDPASVLI